MKNNKNIHNNTLVPMKDVYQNMYIDIVTIQKTLFSATSAKTIRHVLQEIYQYPVEHRVSKNIKHMIEELKECVPAMHMNDITRSDMVSRMDGLLLALQDAIDEEKHNEVLDECRHMFQFMADHAEEFLAFYHKTHQKQ